MSADVTPLAAQAIARAMSDYHGCDCDACLVPYLAEVVRPYVEAEGWA